MGDLLNRARESARQLLRAAWDGNASLTWKASSFAGQASLATEPLTERQLQWLDQLLERNGLPTLSSGGGNG